jgi:imidazolonepropionase-like amidohydrolase
LILITGLVATEPWVTHSEGPAVYAIKDAQIITSAGKTLERGTVVFRDGLIIDVGIDVRVPADARVIDGKGLTVYAGLIDGYTTLGLTSSTPTQRGGGAPGQAPSTPPTTPAPQPEQQQGDPSISAADQVRPGGTAIEDARSVGVTAALTSPRQGILAGQSALINLAGDNAAKMVVRAPVAFTVQFTGGGGGGGGFGGGYPGSLMGTVAFIRQSFYDAIHYRNQIERYERVKRGVTRPEHDKKLAALQPALKGEVPVLFVTNSDGDIRRALSIAEEFKLKPLIAGAAQSYRVTDLLKSKNVPVILSVDFPRRPADLPDDEDEPLRVLRDRADALTAPASLAKAGIKFAFMSGSLRPQDFIPNVQKAIESGLPKEEALRALTSSAAEILGVGDQLGTIETGKIANLVVTSGDLFARDVKIRHVFIDGREVEVKKPEPPGRSGRGQERTGPRDTSTAEWNLVIRSSQLESDLRLFLRQEGDQISGTLSGQFGKVEISSIFINDSRILFTVTFANEGSPIEATVNGTIVGDRIQGVFTIPTVGAIDFTGSRAR